MDGSGLCDFPSSLVSRWVFLALALSALGGCGSRTEGVVRPPKPELPALHVKPLETPRTLAVRPQFSEVAAEAGVEFAYYSDAVPDRYFLPEIMGGGVAWLDYDRDGWLDLYLTNGCSVEAPDAAEGELVNRLYRNLGNGKFGDVTFPAAAGDNGYGQGCAVGDYDADGFPDLYVANYGANVLLHNNGDGTFEDVTHVAGVGDDGWGGSSVWLDVDTDGDLDLYVANFLDVTWKTHKVCRFNDLPGYCGPGEYNGVPDLVYVNQGDGTFVESARALGLVGEDGKGLTVGAVDFDNDLRPEIYVGNDMTPNFLFTRSDVPGAEQAVDGAAPLFAEVGLTAGCAVSDVGHNEASMGLACADFDGDGLVDIFLTHFYAQKNTLYRNLGGLLFQDDSRRARIAATSFERLAFGTVAFDYDRNGAVDLFITCGHVLGPEHEPYEMLPQLLFNEGRGRFDDVSDQAGPYFQDLWLGRGAAGADYDNDGDLDLAVTHLDRPVALLRNDTRTGRHFLGIELATESRVPPVGGRVVVTVDGRQQSVPVMAGGSYHSSGDPRLLFGLGEAAGPVQVEVHWPTGAVETFENLDVDRYWHIMAGQEPWPVDRGRPDR